jgi:hypothetical protein
VLRFDGFYEVKTTRFSQCHGARMIHCQIACFKLNESDRKENGPKADHLCYTCCPAYGGAGPKTFLLHNIV